ncbi:DUF5131 family protein [Gaetbulibacter aestuarii]|uniref:DUF5131 family protein n=1 Tax=Gaetbulibacter aestuarii TaxID=1502358 RepID=A0ABW7N4A1_9FLAO
MIKNYENGIQGSLIEWTDVTWNPWHGCHKISDGCKFCYMYRDKMKYGQNAKLVVKSKTKFKYPYKIIQPLRVFTCSWSDFFIEDADQWRGEAWEIIRNTPHLTYQILTKRPERIMECLPDDWGDGYDNVWLGITVENNATRHRMDTLSRVPAKIRFISFEPLLEQLELADYHSLLTNHFHWAILGGESGNDNGKYRYRPCRVEWLEYLIDVCLMSKVAVFVKQLGTQLHNELNLRDRHGKNIDEFPDSLKVREFPN